MQSATERITNSHLLAAALAHFRREPAILAFLVTLVAICLDYAFAPTLNTITPALSCGLLVLLMLRRRSSAAAMPQVASAWSIAPNRLSVFFILHALIVALMLASVSKGKEVLSGTSDSAIAIAAKYVILLPTVTLLPLGDWRRFARLYRPEWLAASVALLTLIPYRAFRMAWPWYSQALGNTAFALAHPLVPGLRYIAFPAPRLVSDNLDITIDFSCGGLSGLEFFQALFALMVVFDWTALNRVRAFIGYFAGLATMLAANALRIALLAIVGNGFPSLIVHYHLLAGWIMFVLAYAVYLFVAYEWLLQRYVPEPALPDPDLVKQAN